MGCLFSRETAHFVTFGKLPANSQTKKENPQKMGALIVKLSLRELSGREENMPVAYF